ncbi:MAG: translocation/assembly module TamB domain-containing protein [Bacteroidales bacterium]|jgi:hypothetical protein|nr:translocation/assembly module TamB domain-containing protein [Bacteroidales bacterium]MDI9575078.1 translocation/assembly module TamB domain-containing protein [Bacteroidota bacterium]HHW59691.1 translocation/assembly module TamB [Bacteroidales bacterium]HOB77634.1 translocation/assembly module TamB domain-containing protein [Bacteroidales bacterium]HPZ60350.1 translocation/assembly module TamB domain-containing protein [Bacteroidales bacterium]
MSLHKGKKIFKNTILVLAWIICAVPAILIITLKTPTTQKFLIQIFENWWQNNLNAKLEIGAIKIATFTNIELIDVKLYDQLDSTLIAVSSLKAKIKNIAPFSKPFKMEFKDAIIRDPYVNLRIYKGDTTLNMNFIFEFFANEKEKSTPHIFINNSKISNGIVKYVDENTHPSDSTFNYDAIEFFDLNLWISDFQLMDDNDISVKIHNLSAKEKYGFQIKHLDGDFTMTSKHFALNNAHILTPQTYLNTDLLFRYKSFESFQYFVDSVEMNMTFRPSNLSFIDISFFAPELKGIIIPIRLYGSVNGYVNDLHSDKLKLVLGKGSIIDLQFAMKNVTYPNILEYSLALNGRNISNEDISAINIKGKSVLPTEIHLPEISILTLNAKGQGLAEKIDLQFSLENPNEDLFISINGNNNIYIGQTRFNNFNFSQINIPNNPLQYLDGQLAFNFTNLDVNRFNLLKLSGNIDIDLNKILISDIELNEIKGLINKKDTNYYAKINSYDPNTRLDLEAEAQYSKLLSTIKLKLDAYNINMNKLKASRNDSLTLVSAFIYADFKGQNLDDITGNAKITNLSYSEGKKRGTIDSLILTIVPISDEEKKIKIISDLLDLELNGKIYLSSIDKSFKEYIYAYLPRLMKDTLDKSIEFYQDFNFSMHIKPPIQNFIDIFIADMTVSQVYLEGAFKSSTNELDFDILIPYAAYNNVVKADSIHINLETFNNVAYLNLDLDRVINKDISASNIELLSTINRNKIDFQIKIPDADIYYPMNADIQGCATINEVNEINLSFYPSFISIADSTWYISEPSQINFINDHIDISYFELATNTQSIKINGIYGKRPDESISVILKNLQLAQIKNFVTDFQYDIDGNIDGEVELSNFTQKFPNFYADLKFTNLIFNGQKIGNMEFTSVWDTIRSGIKADLQLKEIGSLGVRIPLEAHGYIYPTGKQNMDLKINFNNLNLAILQPLMSSFASNVSGIANGYLNIEGSFSAPQLYGELDLIRTRLKVDYTNVAYSLTTNIKINPNEIIIESLTINDPNANTANGYFIMRHNNFSDITLDTRLTFNKFLAVNASRDQNEYFYGKGLISGALRVQGPINSIKIEGNITTEPGTTIFIPIKSSSVVQQSDFIHFINPKDTITDTLKVETPRQIKSDKTTIAMNLRVSPSPETEINIEFDPRIGDKIMVKANGEIQVTMDTDGNLNLLGDITIVDGYYNLTMQNTINEKFNIDPGSVIKWRGNVMNGEMNITARNNVRTSLYNLVGHLDSSEVYKQKYLVSVLLHITGNFLSPEIKFAIELPEADEDTKNLVKNVLRTEQDVIQQAFSLLLFSSFMPAVGTRGMDIGSGIGTTSFEMLSNQFSNWLSQITGNVDVGFLYSPSETQISLSTQLLEGKLQISSSVGVNTYDAPYSNNSSNFVGDFDLSYKFNDNLKLRLFNKTNPYDQLIYYGPYTQGIGISYSYSFDRIKKLWNKSNDDDKKSKIRVK